MELTLEDIDITRLTKANLVEILVGKLGLNKRESAELVDAFFSIMSDKLVAGEEVKLTDFAAFQVRSKTSRPGRNPRTGAAVEISGRRVVTFQAGPKLKARLQSSVQ